MSVCDLAIKPARGEKCVVVGTIKLVANQGIVGDAHSDRASPRQVLLVSRRTLRDEQLPPGALSENLVLDIDVEELESGTRVRIGDSAELRVMFRCEVCGKLGKIRKGLARRLQGRRGVLARVVKTGAISAGDDLGIIGKRFRSLSDEPRHRLFDLIEKIPYGYVVPFDLATKLIGVHRTYTRVFPKYLDTAPMGLPIHRLVLTDGRVRHSGLNRYRQLLKEEGVEVDREGSVQQRHFWSSETYFAA